MQIVIDIPTSVYRTLKFFESALDGFESSDVKGALIMATLHGTPLPKGHGRLIDADEIQFERTEFETYGDYCIAFDAIDQADTIIEADTEGNESE